MINKCVPFSSDNVLFMLPKVAKNVSLSFFTDQENLWQESFQTKILSMPQERELCFNCKHFMSYGIEGLVMCNRSTNILIVSGDWWKTQGARQRLLKIWNWLRNIWTGKEQLELCGRGWTWSEFKPCCFEKFLGSLYRRQYSFWRIFLSLVRWNILWIQPMHIWSI